MAGFANLYLTEPFWAWATIAAALLALEVATGSGWLLWPAASALAVGLLAWGAGLSTPADLLAFAILTIGSTLLARRYFPRRLAGHARDINDNIGRLVGHEGRAVSGFEASAGRVFIDGKEWAAELAEEGETLAPGARVRVVGVDGARLKVRAA